MVNENGLTEILPHHLYLPSSLVESDGCHFLLPRRTPVLLTSEMFPSIDNLILLQTVFQRMVMNDNFTHYRFPLSLNEIIERFTFRHKPHRRHVDQMQCLWGKLNTIHDSPSRFRWLSFVVKLEAISTFIALASITITEHSFVFKEDQ